MRAVPRPAPETLRGLLGMRVVVVSTLLLSALLIQLTFSIWLPLNPIYYLAAAAYSTSLLALVTLRRLDAGVNAVIQILGDLVVVTGLVWISGGPDSGFTFLYLAVVVSGHAPLREGGRARDGRARLGLLRGPPPADALGGPPAAAHRRAAAAHLDEGTARGQRRDERRRLRGDGPPRRRRLGEAAGRPAPRRAPAGGGDAPAGPPHLGPLLDVLRRRHRGPRTGRITFANPPACELLRRRPEELIGRPLVETGLDLGRGHLAGGGHRRATSSASRGTRPPSAPASTSGSR